MDHGSGAGSERFGMNPEAFTADPCSIIYSCFSPISFTCVYVCTGKVNTVNAHTLGRRTKILALTKSANSYKVNKDW